MYDQNYWKLKAEAMYKEIQELKVEVQDLHENADQIAIETWIYRILVVIGWGALILKIGV